MDKPLSAQIMKAALKSLDAKLKSTLRLIMGGGGAMILAHGYPLATTDIDAIPINGEIESLDQIVKQVAKELGLPGDWLNPYFSTFSYVLPEDYGQRLIRVFDGKFLTVDALGKEEMLIMKCFAHRTKDIGHAKALIRGGANLKLVEDRIQKLRELGHKGADQALDFFDELIEDLS